jgi:hypothetical protein
MSLLRPEVTALAHRYREVIGGSLLAALGLWLMAQGGYLLTPLGLGLLALGGAYALLALRRARFAQGVTAPGMVEVDEAQVGYLGPETGGYVSIADLIEIRLLTLRGRRMWRLKQSDGQALLIPVEASGASALFDAFASLPGIDSAALVAALEAGPAAGAGLVAQSDTPEMRLIWRRAGAGVVIRP